MAAPLISNAYYFHHIRDTIKTWEDGYEELGNPVSYKKSSGPIELAISENGERSIVLKGIRIEDKIIDKDFFKKFKNISFVDIESSHRLSLFNLNINEFEISNCKFDNVFIVESLVEKFQTQDCSFEKITISNSFIYSLFTEDYTLSINNSILTYVSFGKIISKVIKLNGTSVISLSFSNTLILGTGFIQIIDSKISVLNFISVENMGKMMFNRLSPNLLSGINKKKTYLESLLKVDLDDRIEFTSETEFNIQDTDLGNAKFINCDLNSYSKFYFASSKLLEIFLAETELPSKISTSPKIFNELEGYSELEQLKFAHSQFKKIYERQGDNVLANKYLGVELDIYRHILKESDKGDLFSKIRFDNYSERFNLWLNKNSSNYGSNWLRAFVITMGLTIACFFIYCFFLGFRPGNNFELFKQLVSYCLEFVNPIRKADFLKEAGVIKEISNSARVWDYFSRVVIAYFVYQTIQAFRKFGRK